MNSKRDDVSISRAELVVLARFSGSKKPSEEELSAELQRLTGEVKSAPGARNALEALAGRGLLVRDPPKKKSQAKAGAPALPYRLTPAGGSALCSAFGLSSAPTWTQVRNEHLPSLGLGLSPGSAAASEARSSVTMTMVRMKLKMPKDSSLTEICDSLLFRKLGFKMSKITLAELRARLLADALDVSEITTAKNVAESAVKSWLATDDATKQSLSAALARDWVSGQVNHWLDGAAPAAVAGGAKVPDSVPLVAVSLDTLADAVHEALPLIGSDGRYGSEKVFVSAVWHGLAKERRVAGMTFDSFKRSLVQAMRAGKVRLARADLIGAMDAKLVSDSEILDNGSTFHFVLEQKNGAQGADRRNHVR